MSVVLCACFSFWFVRGSLPSSLSCSSGRALVCRVGRAFRQFLFSFFSACSWSYLSCFGVFISVLSFFSQCWVF